ncbi:MAG TPA: alpha/beta hydrolase-fold protein [Pseudonocardiaceae bacterium]|jgi:S-formylglutathione hydrolase FrmB|nr:alpha/beta hydrolase-fold protein [Pseudonocardiaceae bacterium]
MPVNPGPNLPSDVTEHTLEKGLLESPVVWQLLLLAAAVSVYVLFRPRGRRTPVVARPSVASRLVVIGALAGLAGVFWLNDYVGYVRTPHDLSILMQRGTGWTVGAGRGLADITAPDDEYIAHARNQLDSAKNTGGTADDKSHILQVSLPDPARGVPTGLANVMIPPGYGSPANAGRRYPVVYLVHGFPAGSSDDWFTAGDALSTMQDLLGDRLVQQMIVVAPDMTAEQPTTDWECLNVPGGPQLEDYLVNTVVPGIDRQFRTVADRGHRSLGGMSGGAYCALNIGLKHLASFGSLLITLPYDSLGDSAGILAGHPELIAPNTPQKYIPTMKFTYPVSVIIATGKSAPSDVTTTYRVANALAARGQYVAVHLEPGLTHTWRAARAALPYLLAFANQVFGAPPGEKVHAAVSGQPVPGKPGAIALPGGKVPPGPLMPGHHPPLGNHPPAGNQPGAKPPLPADHQSGGGHFGRRHLLHPLG